MLYSQGVSLEQLGIGQSGEQQNSSPEQVWEFFFADHYYLFQGTRCATGARSFVTTALPRQITDTRLRADANYH